MEVVSFFGVASEIEKFVSDFCRLIHHKRKREMGRPAKTEAQSAPKLPKTAKEKAETGRVIVVLCGATLETVKLGKVNDGRYGLLSGEDHSTILKKHNRDPATVRPDITHQVHFAL